MALIYCLKDPVDFSIRYIGKTWTTLAERLRLHVVESRKSKNPTRKHQWILNLLVQYQHPIIEVLEITGKDNWREREVHWIKFGKEAGWHLLNLKKGGDGYDNITHTQEFKDSLRERMKGNTYGKGILWTDSQRQLMLKSRINPWNRGKRGYKVHTDENKARMSERMAGEKHHQAKLSDRQVAELRNKFEQGQTAKQLSAEYGIDYSHCVKITTNKIRKTCVL